MPIQSADIANKSRRSNVIRLGYVRLLDAAPIIIADSLGMFRDADVPVSLSREVGWATIRDKLAFGDLDMAQALSPMPFAMRMGVGVVPTNIIAGLILNCNGNAITLSQRLADEGVNDGTSFARHIKTGFRTRKPVLGVVSLHSSHHFILCRWLKAHKIVPHQDVIISVIPPEQVVRNLASGNIDGFCVGEPWNSMAVEEKIGWCPATSAEIAPGYPEKVLATTERFHNYRPDAHLKVIEVLLKACALCDDEAFRPQMLKILSKSEYLNCQPKTLIHALDGRFPMNSSGAVSEVQFMRFSGHEVNCPTQAHAASVYEDLKRFLPPGTPKSVPKDILTRVYREKIYERVTSPVVS